jgi:hypothetical protein
MDVYVVETGEYEQRYVVGVADSVESAVDCIKSIYGEPYIVEWGDVTPDGWSPDTWDFSGTFEFVPGKSIAHKALFSITKMSVHSARA